MADVIRKATNRFTKGLIMDFSPENTKNQVLTHALNATLLTFNGNELSLQNDMGNGRVETAFLPDGYMPVGTCEYGGIIYIVSYNPLEDKSLIGCFPSPERNISSKELGRDQETTIFRSNFQELIDGVPTGTILHNTLYVLLKNDNLNPGDKFLVCSDKSIYNERLADLWVNKDDKYYSDQTQNPDEFELVSHPIIALNVVSIEDSGKIVYLNSDIRNYDVTNSYIKDGKTYEDIYRYHILGKMAENPQGGFDLASVDPDAYRNVLSSGYSVFKSKTSGKLAILAELIMIDSYSVTHSLIPRHDEYDNIVNGTFDIVLHTEVTPEVTNTTYNTVPKLQYYYLSNSLGYILISDPILGNIKRPMFTVNLNNEVVNKPNTDFYKTNLNDIYTSTTKDFIIPDLTIGNTGKFNFPKPYSYHGRMISYEGDILGTSNTQIYTKFVEGLYHRIDYSLISANVLYYRDNVLAKFYKYNAAGDVHKKFDEKEINESYTYYVREPDHKYYDINRDTLYKNTTLYKIVTLPVRASKELIYNTEIEKFLYLDVYTYRIATQKDKEAGKTLYYKEGNDYKSVIGVPDPTKTYFILEIKRSLVSIGYEIDMGKVTGEIYYYPDTKTYEQASEKDKTDYFDEETYPIAPPFPLYRREDNWKYIAATDEQINNYLEFGSELYYSTNYILIKDIHLYSGGTIFIVVPMDTFVDYTKFKPDLAINYIYGKDKPAGDYPKDDPIYLFTIADFIPTNLNEENTNNYKYPDLKLANITLPSIVYTNGLDLPFKYDYTIVPCMNYGKLDHLAVSNTIDFSKLHAFNLSEFHIWKYRIDNNQLRLTFGANVYDTYETYKVDGLVLEFYDCWGFAGSLEIVDKKSYSGIFTKIIPLNSLKVLSRKKILANDYSENYVHNINIKEKFNETTSVLEGYIFNDKPVSYANSTEGWSGIDEEDNNDCGTLYSNILYGVKAYLRRTTKNGKEFLHKQDFFLYTLPIYNDFYYQINNFNNLQNPLLDLMLTYKIKDTSNRVPYTDTSTEDSKIENGYIPSDKKEIGDYLGGFSDKSSIDVIKYYKYIGTSDLYLEVGLKKEYESLNISYSSDINKIFECKLWLLSDDDEKKTFSVNSGIDGLVGESLILNYNNGEIAVNPDPTNSINYLKFESGERTTVADENFYNANFITNEGNKPIKINYLFVVGYTANINDIRNTLVQATTVCALFHKKSDGEYNYEDFGVYLQQSSETNQDGTAKMDILSSIMFYNEGDAEKEVFGICKQISIKPGTSIMNLCSYTTSVETDAQEIKTAGLLNSGDPLKQLVTHIGKLTFCQPHAHGFSESKGVNIYTAGSSLGIAPNYGDWVTRDLWSPLHNDDKDDCYGMIPTNVLFNNPRYNMSLNTKNSINYHSEFISTIDGDIVEGPIYGYDTGDLKSLVWSSDLKMRAYTGFTGQELATFNEKMIETFKYVYAYNPDYDSLTVNVGNISLLDYNPYFTSNLISEDAKLNFKENKTLNDFIYLGPINFANYLQHLKEYSKSIDESFIEVEFTDSMKNTHFLPQVLLLPNYDYCGTPENYYLLTNLTYNTPVPRDLELELEFSSSDNIVIKHHTGENTFMKGTPNRKTLYGYNEQFNKMIQLDVSNYTIDSSGKLSVKNTGTVEKFPSSLELNVDSATLLYQSGQHSFTQSFTNLDGEQVELDFIVSLNMYSNNGYLVRLKNGTYTNGLNTLQGCVYGVEHGVDMYNSKSGTISITPKVWVSSYNNKEDYTYNVTIDNIELEYTGVMVNDDLSLNYGSSIRLMDQDYNTLSNLISEFHKNITLIDNNNTPVNTNNRSYQVNMDEMSNRIIFKESYESNLVTFKPDTYGSINLNYSYQINRNPNYNPGSPEYGYNGSYVILLFDFKIKNINFTVTLTSKLETSEESFIKTTRTNKYATTNGHIYTVMDDYKPSCIRGSSITLNDLVYEPNLEGHRLFIKNNCFTYNNTYRSKIYYRDLSTDKAHSWTLDKLYLNNIYMFTGPCYTSSNL